VPSGNPSPVFSGVIVLVIAGIGLLD